MTAPAPRAPMPPGPLAGSFAWQAAAFKDYDAWALHVTSADIAEIENAAAATKAAGLDIRSIAQADFPLPGLAPKLAARGLLLVGLDLIGDYVTEINVTSPTCFQEIRQQKGFDVARLFVDKLEAAVARPRAA